MLYPLERLSRQSRSNPYWLSTDYIDALHQNGGQRPGLLQWTNHIFNESIQQQQQPRRTRDSLSVLKSYIIVFEQLLEYIMREKVEQELILITDLPLNDIFVKTVSQRMKLLNIHIQVEHVSVQNIYRIDDTVHEIVANEYRIVVLMLPWEIGERIIQSADRNYLINSGKVITWISFNMEGRVHEWKCIHNIPLHVLVEATYEDGEDTDSW